MPTLSQDPGSTTILTRFDQTLFRLISIAPEEGSALLAEQSDSEAARLLVHMNQASVRELLGLLTPDRRDAILAAAPEAYRDLWLRPVTYAEDCIGRLMRPPVGVVPAHMPVIVAIEEVKRLSRTEMVTYLYATDRNGVLAGVLVMRDLFLAEPWKSVEDVMIKPPFFLTPEMKLLKAMKAVVSRHYPVYPVCTPDGHLLGLVRGSAMFEEQAILISAQSGSMEGVRAKERLSTSWKESLKFRHPWLQVNLGLSLLSVVVMSCFRTTLQQLIIVAVFSPLVTAQARNSSAQTMAIVLRGLNSGEWEDSQLRRILTKECLLGIFNGAVVGILSAGLVYWHAHGGSVPPRLMGWAMFLAMTLSCGFSALMAVCVPLGLRRMGADPALAAGIILATIAGVFSQFIYLLVAFLLVR